VTFAYHLDGTVAQARAGTLRVPHGTVRTPAFMPVGTQGSVKTLSPLDLTAVGAQMVLANTYHLHLRPGEQVVSDLGGLHRFMSWDGPLLTDSGGFQVFSLEGLRGVTEEGVAFQSHVDGTHLSLTPETAMDIQWALGPDVAMALDHVVPGTASRAESQEALDRTTRWLERCRTRHRELTRSEPTRQTLWPIIQGGVYPDQRRTAVERITQMGNWTGVAIGGLAVGETKNDMLEVLENLHPAMPRDVPRYLMGVGFPDDLLRAIARGVDLFDCVAPTRNGRNGSAFTADGPVNIRNAAHRTNPAPLDDTCDCETCTRYSRGYLRHLIMAEEMLGLRLMSLHNVRFLVRLAEDARLHILDGTFESWSKDRLDRFERRGN
jgi:queuine tRNA-ribosyltransferase